MRRIFHKVDPYKEVRPMHTIAMDTITWSHRAYNGSKYEIHFIDLVFTLHPKISEAWEHRSWCVREMLRLRSDAESGADRSVMHLHELDVCEAVAVRYPKNYYAWSHR